MDKDLILSYLWNDVFQLGFCIEDGISRKRWLNAFFGSFREFWGLNEHQKGPSSKDGKIVGRIDNSHYNLWIEFALNDNGHLHVEFGHIDGRIMFHHSDPRYFIPSLDKILDPNKRNVAVGEFESQDISVVLSSCIFHPRDHIHVSAPAFDHQVRIGCGMSNPFLYLFHLRYQLCPIPEKRIAEERRLLDLFENAIKNNSKLSAIDLMAQPAM